MTDRFRLPSFEGKNVLNPTAEQRRRQALKTANALANNKFSHGGKKFERAPVSLAYVPPPVVEHQPTVEVVTRAHDWHEAATRGRLPVVIACRSCGVVQSPDAGPCKGPKS